MKKEKVLTSVDAGALTDADIEALDRKFEMMSAECCREMSANYGDPSVDYSKVDFSKPD